MFEEWPTIVQGDAEAAVVDILINMCPELSAAQVTISTNLIGYEVSKTWVTVTQLGAIEKWPNLYRPRIDLDVYADRRSVALDVSQYCLAALRRNAGNYDNFGFRYTGMHIESGPTRLPDHLEESCRYVTSVRLYGRSSDFLPLPT